jgi:predicted O-methyltransferase YrrM
VSSTLRSPTVAGVLDRLHTAALVEDEPAKERIRAREEQLGERLAQAKRYELYGDAPLAITREVGELLYVLALGRRARRIVEFGASLGVSTVYLAAAVRDCGGGSLLTTELRSSKAEIARRNLADAGLAELVELRVGDARQTLTDLDGPVDLLFLDGRNDRVPAGPRTGRALPVALRARGSRFERRGPGSATLPGARPRPRSWLLLDLRATR